jgi:hypothetical protein
LWAFFGDEGIKDTPRKVKGRRELLNLNYSINYDAKGVSIKKRFAHCKDAWVADHIQFGNGNLQRNIFFTRPVHDWEVEVVSSFFQLYSHRLRQGGEDRIC